VLGVDGNPLTTDGRGGHTFPGGGRAEFLRLDLDRPFPADLGHFDWAMSFAVAEHVPFQYEHIFLANLYGASRHGLLLVWDQRDSPGTGHINTRDEAEVLRLVTALGYKLDSEATAELRAGAQLRWYKLAMVLRHGGEKAASLTTALAQDSEACWYKNILAQRAIAEIAREEHQRACWPPGWANIKAKCCKTGKILVPEADTAASSCFGAGFSYHVCCATMKDYYIF